MTAKRFASCLEH